MGSTLPPSPVAPFSPFFITSSRSSPRQLPTYLGNSATPPYTVVHLSFTHSVTRPLSLFLSLRAPPRWPLTPCNNARVYTVCPHPPAYIFASYNIDYFGRISGRAARELRPFLRLEPSHRASPRRAVPTTPRRTSHPVARVRPAFSQSLVVDAASTTLPPPPSSYNPTSQCRLFAFAFGDSPSTSVCHCTLQHTARRYNAATRGGQSKLRAHPFKRFAGERSKS